MVSGRSTLSSRRSHRSPRRFLSDDERDDLRGEIKEGLHETRQLLTEVMSRLGKLESTFASQSVVVEKSPGFRNPEAVAYVASADHCPSIPFPGNPGISGTCIGPVGQSQHLQLSPRYLILLIVGAGNSLQTMSLSIGFELKVSLPYLHPYLFYNHVRAVLYEKNRVRSFLTDLRALQNLEHQL